MRFLFDKQIIRQKNGEIKPCARKSMVRCTELEIVSAYNAELRGICNYYFMASNYNRISYFAWHCGGDGNNTHISFEICEDGLTDAAYFSKVYQEAIELCAYSRLT